MSKVKIALDNFKSELSVRIADTDFNMYVDKRMIEIIELVNYNEIERLLTFRTNVGEDYLSLEDLVEDDMRYRRIPNSKGEALLKLLNSLTLEDIELDGGDKGVFRSVHVDGCYDINMFDNVKGMQFIFLKSFEGDKLGILRYIGLEDDSMVDTLLETLRKENLYGYLEIVVDGNHTLRSVSGM